MYKNPAHSGEFKDYGAPARVTGLFGRAAGVDRDGHPVFYQARGQAPDPFFLLVTRIDTGETKQFAAQSSASNYPWGICVTQSKVYIGSCCDGCIYEFDIQSEEFRLIGRPSDTETYIWALTEGPDGIIYGSTFGNCRLVGYDPHTRTLLDLARLDPAEHYARYVVTSQHGFLYVGVGTSKAGISAYEIATGRVFSLVSDMERVSGTGWVARGSDGTCYGSCVTKSGKKHYRFDGSKAIEIEENELPPHDKIEFADGSELLSVDENSQTLHIRDSGSGDEREVPFSQEASGTSIFCLTKGPDEKVYMSSILPLYICTLDPQMGETELLGRVDGAEVYSFVNYKGKLWMAAYAGGIISEYDPSKSWNPSKDPSGNPHMLPGGNAYIHRPYRMVVSPDTERILICGIPDYGLLGGSLVVLNPETCEKEAEYRNIIQDHSIKGLCLTTDGLVCGGSSTEGGGGAHTLNDDAQVFLWDYFERRKTFSTVAVAGAKSVSDLILGSDGMIYGLADNTIFVFDPVKREVIHTEEFTYGVPAFNALALSPRGTVLALLGSDIVEIQSESYRCRSIARYSDLITAGVAVVGDTVYFGCRSHVIGFRLS
jgi:streptogramin lyase